MNKERYLEFDLYLRAGRRKDAKISVQKFIDSFQDGCEREIWVKQYLETYTRQQGIFFPLYKDLIFPVLAKGYMEKDLWSILWLARTNNNIAKGGTTLYNQIGNLGALGLLLLAYELEPTSEEVIEELSNALMAQLNHSFHEWPAGVLNGMNCATLKECDRVAENIDLALKLNVREDHKKLLQDYKTYLDNYRDHLAALK